MHDDTERATCDDELPKFLWVWDNQARLSLPPGLMIWLGFLVVTCLGSLAFVGTHVAALWVFVGFIMSHVIVFGLGTIDAFTLRRGFVSLSHVLCWSPGLAAVVLDSAGRDANTPYAVWSYCLIGVLSVSLVLDLRDGFRYLSYLIKGRVKAVGGTKKRRLRRAP